MSDQALSRVTVAVGFIVVDTPLSRILGNFYLSVSKPIAPTRLFDDEVSAVAWLQESVGQQ